MELWWLLVILPLYNLWAALRDAWPQLLDTDSEWERKSIIERAGVKALLNVLAVAGMWLIPWPYKIICFLPTILPRAFDFLGHAIVITFEMKTRD